MSAATRQRLAAAVAERAARRPLSQILGLRAFYEAEFETSPDVLDPRPESEALVAAALEDWPVDAPRRVLDLGVGSGCLLLSVLLARPAATGLGVDASPAALAVARRNRNRLGLVDRAEFQLGNWTAGIEERFDIVLCNPPYIPLADWRGLDDDVRLYEPKAALTPGEDGLAVYRALADAAGAVIAPGGRALFETGRGQARDVAALYRGRGFRAELRADLGGVERVVIVWPE